MVKTIIIVIIGMFICLVGFQAIDPNIPQNDPISQSVNDKNMLSLTIEGEVVMPGKYKVDNDAILEDLITAARGLLESADEDAINLSARLDGHDSYYIPAKSEYSNNCEITSEVQKVNINEATLDQLMTISGIKETLASRIIEYREQNGPFLLIEDLMNVSGIGKVTYQSIRDYVTLK